MRKTFAKAVTWRLIGTAEIFAISFWMTGHVATAGHTAGIAAIASFLSYIIHELAWNGAFSRKRVADLGRTIALYVVGLSTQITSRITQPPKPLALRCGAISAAPLLSARHLTSRWTRE